MSENETNTEHKAKGRIYHYTDQNGLMGILENDCIWATHYRFLNDASERQGAVDFFLEIDQMATEGIHVSDRYKGGLRESLNLLLQMADAYFVSFSEEGDEPQSSGDRLSQWRGYALNRQGFSLGFDTNDLNLKTIKWTHDMQLATILLSPCIYEEESKSYVVKTIITEHGESLKRIALARSKDHHHQSEQIIEDHAWRSEFRKLQMNFLDFTSKFKHYGFKEEQEQRLVVYVLDRVSRRAPIEFRDGAFGRTPYIKIPLGLKDENSPLKRIVVGPSQNKDQIVVSLKLELAKMGIKGVEIVPSQIPYRNW